MNNNNAMMVFLGAIAIVIGAFLPFATLVAVDVSYWGVAHTEKFIFLAGVIAAPVLLFMGKDKFMILSTLIAWVSLLFPVIKGLFKSNDGGLLKQISSEVTNTIGNKVGSILFDFTNYEWGAYVFLAGLLIFTIGTLRVWKAR